MGQSKSKHKHVVEQAPTIVEDFPELVNIELSNYMKEKENLRFFSEAIPKIPNEHGKVRWSLIYNSDKHGKSFNRFLYHVTWTGPCLIILRDHGGNVFGGYFSENLKDKYQTFYGTAKNFVFQLHPERKLYRTTGFNQNYQYLNQGTQTLFNGLAMGGQLDFFAWCIRDDFEGGHSKGNPSTTYGNPMLASSVDFLLDYMEVWNVGPQTVYESEKYAKKSGKKSVLDDDDNFDKVITAMSGHNFASYDINEETGKTDKKEMPNVP